jgi:hypothetical protein
MPLEEVINKLRARLANKYDKWAFGWCFFLAGFLLVYCGESVLDENIFYP